MADDSSSEDLAHWTFEQVKHGDKDVMVTTDQVDGHDLILVKGVTVVDDETAPKGKALVFDGTQATAVQTAVRMTLGVKFRITLNAKISSAATDKDETLFYYFGGLELRYSPTTKMLSAIVYPKKNDATGALATPIELKQPIALDKWVTIQASVIDSAIELKVDQTSTTSTIPEGQSLRVYDSTICFGIGGPNNRAYTGSLSDVSLSQPK